MAMRELSPWSMFQSADIQAGNDTTYGLASFGDDYLAGGAGNDVIFGELGNDVIQGDGAIDTALTGGVRVGASRATATDGGIGDLTVHPSFEAATDGSDYIEGGGGNDVIFGGLGQDDLVGGSSDFYSPTAAQRPDGSDIIFGGAGTEIARNLDPAGTDVLIPASSAHASDADTIVGDNGDIVRIVGINHVDDLTLASPKKYETLASIGKEFT